jgi:hypothetical protein
VPARDGAALRWQRQLRRPLGVPADFTEKSIVTLSSYDDVGGRLGAQRGTAANPTMTVTGVARSLWRRGRSSEPKASASVIIVIEHEGLTPQLAVPSVEAGKGSRNLGRVRGEGAAAH